MKIRSSLFLCNNNTHTHTYGVSGSAAIVSHSLATLHHPARQLYHPSCVWHSSRRDSVCLVVKVRGHHRTVVGRTYGSVTGSPSGGSCSCSFVLGIFLKHIFCGDVTLQRLSQGLCSVYSAQGIF